MQSKITLFFLVLISTFCFSQNKDFDYLKEKLNTKILFNRVSNISEIDKSVKETVSALYFRQVYHELQRADYYERMPKYDWLKEQISKSQIKNQVPLSILISDFESIKDEKLSDSDLSKKDNKTVFNQHQVCLIAPLLMKAKGQTLDFILEEKFIFNTTNVTISSIRANFNNGKGWMNITTNQIQKITFQNSGMQTIVFEISLSNGKIINQKSSFEVDFNQKSQAQRNGGNEIQVIENITATIPYQGFGETAAIFGQGEYEIFLDNVDQVLDKPIFLLDGFDPGDTRNSTLIYSSLDISTGGNLANNLRDLGYDIIVLNFPSYTVGEQNINGGADFIQRNAMIFVELLNQINAQKVGNAQNVVIGPSMGGLISRYALRYMEQNSLDHDTRLYISFDTPHLGANVPIGFQHLFNYMAYGPLGDVTLQELVDNLFKSPAARQMLLDHLEGHLQSGSATEFSTTNLLPIGAPNYRTAFQNELNTMGFPQNTRNVAISNGSGNSTMTGTPGMAIMDYTLNITTTQRAIINLKFTPAANLTNQVSRFRGQQNIVFWITIFESLANAKSIPTSAGFDSAPGGTFDISAFAEGAAGNPTLDEFLNNLLIDKFCFIPTLSSLAITSNNWYTAVNSSSNTPFVNTFVPTINEPHVTLSEGNILFTLNEILNEPLTVSSQNVMENLAVKNPIGNQIEIFTNQNIENASVTIFDTSGKNILTLENINIVNNFSIPVNLTSGFYFLTIKNELGFITKKLIKN